MDQSPEQRVLLASWAAKTAILLNLSSNFHSNAPTATLRMLREGELSGVQVFAQQHHGVESFSWIQGGLWRQFGEARPETALGPAEVNGLFRVSMQLGKLLLLVSGPAPLGWTHVLLRGIHIPLWPHAGPILWYDTPDFPWRDSERALATFHTGLALSADVDGPLVDLRGYE